MQSIQRTVHVPVGGSREVVLSARYIHFEEASAPFEFTVNHGSVKMAGVGGQSRDLGVTGRISLRFSTRALSCSL
jgi:hypothetical protein